MLAGITSRQLSEWMAFERIEPFEDGFWQAGMIAATIANVMGNAKKRWTPEDFMPMRRSGRTGQAAAVTRSIMLGAAARQNARV